jgi:hypothetical protein
MRTAKRHIGGKAKGKKVQFKNLSRSMPPIISVGKNGSITPYQSRTNRNSNTRSKSKKSKSKSIANNKISLNVRNEAEADNALEVMKKSPITIVLVFANWCPHCHSYMETWNKLKSGPRTAPMVEMDAAAEEPGAKEAVKEFLGSIKGPDGAPMEVNAFPTVLSVRNNKGKLEAEPVENSRDEGVMKSLLNTIPEGVEEKEESPKKTASAAASTPEEANLDMASMPIPTAAESIAAATRTLEENLKNNSVRAGLANLPTSTPKEVSAKPASISQKALDDEEKKMEDKEADEDIFESPVNTPAPDDFVESPTAEELDSGESTASRKAAPPGLAGGARVRTGGSLFETLSTYAAGSPMLAAAAPAAILLAAQQTAARRARIGVRKSKTRKGGARKRKTLKRK